MDKKNIFHKARLVYLIIILLFVGVSFYFRESIEGSQSFNYWSSIATIVALIISASEVFISANISKKLNSETIRLQSSLNTIIEKNDIAEHATSKSHCIILLDEISNYLSDENYLLSIIHFKIFRRSCNAYFLKFNATLLNGDTFNSIEHTLTQYSKATADALPNKNQKKLIMNKILNIKSDIEKQNSNNEVNNVS